MTSPEYILAIDYGEKRVGLAIAHHVARLARPLKTLSNTPQLLDDLQRIIAEEQVGLVVVGLPRSMDGGYTAQTKLVEEFRVLLATHVNVEVHSQEETLSSVEAEASLKGTAYTKADVDAVAASYILERYLANHIGEQ